MPGKGHSVELLASAVQTATGQGTAVTGLGGHRGGTFVLTLTNAATEVDDTLNVYVQRLLPDGTTWDDVVAFTQILGNGADSLSFVADVNFDSAASDERATSQETLTAGTVSAVALTNSLRVTWVIVDPGGGAASFTFGVAASLF